jgi:hypothetical protein
VLVKRLVGVRNGRKPLLVYALVGAVLSFLPRSADAHFGYHWAGVSSTAKVAYTAQVTITMLAHPKNCELGCHSIAYQNLWDYGPGGSGNFVQAGVALDWRYPSKIALWWESQDNIGVNQTGDYVPLGTPVTIEMQKNDGEKFVTVRWKWKKNGKDVKPKIIKVKTPQWVKGPGVHPVFYEMLSSDLSKYSYSKPLVEHPGPVWVRFSNVMIYPQDLGTVFLYSSPPYKPTGTITEFEVRYPQ